MIGHGKVRFHLSSALGSSPRKLVSHVVEKWNTETCRGLLGSCKSRVKFSFIGILTAVTHHLTDDRNSQPELEFTLYYDSQTHCKFKYFSGQWFCGPYVEFCPCYSTQ